MTTTALRGYAATIAEAIGTTDRDTLAEVEDTMRHVIFHSTLDWQSAEEFRQGAREAFGLVKLKRRGGSVFMLPDDPEIARLLNVQPDDVPALAKEADTSLDDAPGDVHHVPVLDPATNWPFR
jgi:hypothetical protein